MTKAENKNAMKHGVFAEAVILPGEDATEFEELHNSLINEWKPAGPTEHETVLSLANDFWRNRRKVRYRQSEVATLERKTSARQQFRMETADELSKFLDRAKSGALASITEQDLSTQLPTTWANYLNEYRPRRNYDSENAWLSAIIATIDSGLSETKANIRNAPKIEETYCNEARVTRELVLDERIDAMIDKKIKRLVQTKAMKTFVSGSPAAVTNEPLKQIAAPATQTEDISFLSDRL